jgi:hypothetical protein
MKNTVTPFKLKSLKILLLLAFTVFFSISAVYAQRDPIDINIIIDGSESLINVKEEVRIWLSGRLDQILAQGDRVTVWSAASSARIIYSGRMDSSAETEAVKKSIADISPSGINADLSGALRQAAGQQSAEQGFSYTLLISASPAALSSTLSGPQANLLRHSRVEEFPAWRAFVIGLNLDSRVKRAAASFINAQ